MRKFCLIVTVGFLVSAIVHAQDGDDTAIQLLKQLPKGGLLLDKGWIFYPGDDTGYANYNYKGKNGVAINPGLLLDQLPVVRNSGIGWFRLKLKVDSSLRNKVIGITLSMLGAAEMYLDNQLIYKVGHVSADYNQEKTQAIYSQVLNLKLGNEEKQLLAVRYSYHKNNPYFKLGVIPYCMLIRVTSLNENINSYGLFVKRLSFFNGVALCTEITAAVLTLFFFFSFRSRKEYLYFGIYFALQFFGTVFQSDSFGMGKDVKYSANQVFTIAFAESALFIAASIFYLNGVYALFKKSRTKFYWFLVCYGFLSLAVIPFLPTWGGTFATLFFPLTCFEILPAYYRAMRIGFRGARILFFSLLVTLLVLIIFSKAVIENDLELSMILFAIVLLIPALGLVIFLAGDFARTSLSLRLRIVEVEELSKKTIAQEKEKHEILAGQKDKLEIEVKERTAELTRSFAELKATQAQLIQQEKMASLGELTAGIAHEIQNPLNFVNNFSDVNTELVDELKSELSIGNTQSAIDIAESIKENEKKINYHGKRADSIVKGMLQHSRTSSGQKELTDINALVDEYLRLAYHGMRARDKNFNARTETDLDASVGKINIVPQDIGRVLLNLYNNAFYAVSEKQKQNIPEYGPLVTVSTKHSLFFGEGRGEVMITVVDNGNGIPQKIVDKIFQPFFTTKPTGQGTGLGLSLAYDIVKAHGGEIKVESKEGEGSQFTITLPLIR